MTTLTKTATIKNVTNKIVVCDPCYLTDNRDGKFLKQIDKNGKSIPNDATLLGFAFDLPEDSAKEIDTYAVMDGSQIQGMLIDFSNSLNGVCPDFSKFTFDQALGTCSVDSGTVFAIDTSVVTSGFWNRKAYEKFICGNWADGKSTSVAEKGVVFGTTYGDGGYNLYTCIKNDRIVWLMVDFAELVTDDWKDDELQDEEWQEDEISNFNPETEQGE